MTKRILILTGALLAASAAAFGCGDDRPASSDPGAVTPADGGPTTTSDGAAPTPPTEPGLCDLLDQRSQTVAEYAIAGTADIPAGGAIVEGTYVLNELRFYGADAGGSDPGPPAMTGRYARATLVATARSLRMLRTDGSDPDALPAETLTVDAYTATGATLSTTAACTTLATRAAVGYSADANYITLFPAPGRVEVFVLRAF